MIDKKNDFETSENLLSSGLKKVVDILSEDKVDDQAVNWKRDNILSIRECVKNGNHKTIYYPACGHDIFRPLIAYDADHLIAIDFEKGNKEQFLLKQIKDSGLFCEIKEHKENKSTEITFFLDSRQRKITLAHKDARLLSPNEFGMEKVDVLHLYLPTGADVSVNDSHIISDETKKDIEQIPDEKKEFYLNNKVERHLSWSNYSLVNVNGFMVFDEESFNRYSVPKSFQQIIGLKERQITSRYPKDISTFHFDLQDTINDPNSKIGYIYQKTKDIDRDLFDVCKETLTDIPWIFYELEQIRAGQFEMLANRDEGQKLDFVDLINVSYINSLKIIEEIIKKFDNFVIEKQLLIDLKNEFIDHYKIYVRDIRAEFYETIAIYHEQTDQYLNSKLSEEELYDSLSLKFKHNRFESNKWPAMACLFDSDEQKCQDNYYMINVFIQNKFDFDIS